MKYSVIIPVYNRPDEVKELLESIVGQRRTTDDIEVIVVEDGSSNPCEDITKQYTTKLNIKYYTKPNSGPGPTRNYAADRANGDYLIILDSDTVLPPDYFSAIDKELATKDSDAFGGPDRAHKDFSPIQKAINYGMTSFFTTGGIRGGKKKMDKFYPRSFNMGVKRTAYQALGGFGEMRFGEDIDMSIRIFKNNYDCRLFPDAWVWHKRRTNFRKFFKQVHNSGIARIHLEKRHPGSMKLVHMLPAFFTIGVTALLIGEIWCKWSILPLIAYALLIMLDASIKEHSLKVGALAVIASYVQLLGYGTGFLRAFWKRMILRKGEFSAYNKTFYK